MLFVLVRLITKDKTYHACVWTSTKMFEVVEGGTKRVLDWMDRLLYVSSTFNK